MSEPIWVCSKWNQEPKDEDKYRLTENQPSSDYYFAIAPKWLSLTIVQLLKIDYHECPAPEQWKRVEVTVSELYGNMDGIYRQTFSIPSLDVGDIKFHYPGYRVVSLVVERRTA